MSNRPNYIAFVVVAVLVLILLGLPAHDSSRLKQFIGGLFVPLFGLVGSTQSFAHQASNLLPSKRELASDLEKVRNDNQQLQFRIQQLEEIWKENQLLRQSLGWQKRVPRNMRLARVIARDPMNSWSMVHIDLGSRDGIRVDYPVMTPEGLVGKIHDVSYGRSQVVLVGDPNCRVPALVLETQDTGVVTPATLGTLDKQIVDLSFLPSNVQLRPGQRVFTSGLGELYPRDIPIGRIVDVRSVGFGMYAEARVKLEVNLNRLSTVWVLLP